MLKTLGAFAHLHRRVVVAIWIAIIAVLAGLVGTFGNAFSTQFNLPNVESAEGFSLLEERFGSQASGRSGTVVVQSTSGSFSEAQRQALDDYFAPLVRLCSKTDAWGFHSDSAKHGANQRRSCVLG